AAKKATDLPLVLVNTHGHLDHIGCNDRFPVAHAHPLIRRSSIGFDLLSTRRPTRRWATASTLTRLCPTTARRFCFVTRGRLTGTRLFTKSTSTARG
ncbi:MAG: MBL fold metallo-hydrolase, partial [Thermoguttaceae bacterium]|nr:MBL fold metallo-hydrolase [Thermoguttaceae bacterium]